MIGCHRSHWAQAQRLPTMLPWRNTGGPRPSFPRGAVAPPSAPRYGRPSSPCHAPFGCRRRQTTRPSASGLSKKHASLRFNLPPWSSRYLNKSSTWGDVEGSRPGTLPVQFKTQTCVIFSRAAGPMATNRPLLALRTPRLHTLGGYNAPSVHRSRAQARDA